MDNYNHSIDGDSLENSRGETLVDRLRHEVRQKEKIIEDKNLIISSLRGQLKDLQNENEELENNEQLLRQKYDRCKKELDERNEELEAVSRTVRELEAANEILKQRLDARIGQLQKYVDGLKQTKKVLDEVHLKNEEFQADNERLNAELESLKHKQNLRSRDRECDEADQREIQELKAQIKSLKQTVLREQALTERAIREKALAEKALTERTLTEKALTQKVQFSVADEVGEIMDSRSIPCSLKEKRCLNESELWDQHGLGPKRAAGLNDTMNGKYVPPSRNFLANPNVTKSQLFEDPIAEHKMRLARVNELARRNNLTKPLHQTSYALEYDTFADTTNLTENEIKRGNVPRQALSDFSNQPRRPVKKAEAFIV